MTRTQKLALIFLFLGLLSFSSQVRADDLSQDDLDQAEKDTETPKPAPDEKTPASPAQKAESKPSASPDDLDAELEDSKPLPKSAADDEGVREALTPDKNAPQATPEANIDDLDKSLEETKTEEPKTDEAKAETKPPTQVETKTVQSAAPKEETKTISQVPKSLRENPEGPSAEFDYSDQFYKVPLRPQMSDANWKRWAGPVLSKIYKIRKRDTLWAVSERLFGNPYLWPKVWQLNANFSNPHVIDPGIELEFIPGNPHSAPALALKGAGDSPLVSLTESFTKLSFMDSIDTLIREQQRSDQPPFQYLLTQRKPESVAKMPEIPEEGRVYYRVGQVFQIKDVEDGHYAIVHESAITGGATFNDSDPGFRLHWVGQLSVKGGVAKVDRAFAEIEEGDLITSQDFSIPQLSLHKEKFDEELSKKIELLSLQEGAMSNIGSYSAVGIRFPNENGPAPGAVVNFVRGPNQVGSGVLISRDGKLGTIWMVDAERELQTLDHIE